MAESLRERQREAVERLCAKSPKGKPVETGTENAGGWGLLRVTTVTSCLFWMRILYCR